ncbi:MAG: hypothetical protein ACI82A_002036 [Candidatus Azotimanducaceae bacterium]
MNIPWDTLDIDKSDPIVVHDILENQLGARRSADVWSFDNVNTLLLPR